MQLMSNLGRTPMKRFATKAVKRQCRRGGKLCKKMYGSSDFELMGFVMKLVPKSPRAAKTRSSNSANQQLSINAMRKHRWIVVQVFLCMVSLPAVLDPKVLIAPQLRHRRAINQQPSTNALRKHCWIVSSEMKMWMAIRPTIPALPH